MKKTSHSNQIHFHYLVEPFYFPHRRRVKEFLLRQLSSAGRRVETINYIFCNDEYLLNINKQYLKHDTYTDIVTFELSEKEDGLIADIFISIERVKENASLLKNTFKDELHRVIFHGALHLAGHKDKSPVEKEKMREMENAWMKNYDVSREINIKKD